MAKDDITPRKHRCSFCGKTADQVRRLVAGPGAYICNECIALCQEIIADDLGTTPSQEPQNLPKPTEIKAVLDEYVIGQDKAKRALAVAVYNGQGMLSCRKSAEVIVFQRDHRRLGGSGVLIRRKESAVHFDTRKL